MDDVTNQIQQILLKSGNAIHGHDSDDPENIKYASIAEWKSTVLFDQHQHHTTIIASSSCENDDDTNLTITQPSTATTATTSLELRQRWYDTGYEYYQDESKCPATVDGVLGGFACLSTRDLKASQDFIRKLQRIRPEFIVTKCENDNMDTYALECGAGIGRVSKGLLLPMGFTICDLVEPSQRLLSHAPDYIGQEYAARCRYFCSGLQDFTPQPDTYNIIFIQWVIGYLTDDDLVSFLQRCAVGLRRGGVIVIKDNTCTDEAFVADAQDSSVTRSLPYILAIVHLAGLRIVLEEYQDDFPENIFPVPMLALCPI